MKREKLKKPLKRENGKRHLDTEGKRGATWRTGRGYVGTDDLEGCICSRKGGSRFLNLHIPYMLVNVVCCEPPRHT